MMVSGCGAFARGLGHDGGTLINGISTLTKENPESSFVSFTTWGRSEKLAVYEPGSGFSPDTESAYALILDFPSLHRNKFLFFIRYPVCGILL